MGFPDCNVNAMSVVDDHNGLSPPKANQAHHHTPPISQETASNSNATSRDQKAILKDAAPLSFLVLYFMAIHFLLAYCELILVAPLIELFEQSLCISYYDVHDPSIIGPGGNVPELMCKIQTIQAPLATIRGWKSLFDTIPGCFKLSLLSIEADFLAVLVIAIPFGKLADRYGRRKLMMICLLGVATSFGEVFIVCMSLLIFLFSTLIYLSIMRKVPHLVYSHYNWSGCLR
jgi:hypothetical protein